MSCSNPGVWEFKGSLNRWNGRWEIVYVQILHIHLPPQTPGSQAVRLLHIHNNFCVLTILTCALQLRKFLKTPS